jgi:hypothetical protein
MTGIVFGESPRWHDDRLWFSYWGVQEVVAVDFEGNSASGLVILTYEPDRNQEKDRS